MIAKIVIGGNFSGAVNYIIDKGKNAEIIDSEGLRLKDNNSIINSFNTQLELNPNISKPVYHISLDFSAQDINNLTNEKMKLIARDYMKKMGISNTQYIAVRHFDKEHPHIHICINRIDNNGKLLSNKNDRYRSEKVCKELTVCNRLYYASGKEKVKVHRLKEPDKSRYEIYNILKDLIPQSANWQELELKLQQRGIDFKYKYKGARDTIQGVIFYKNGFSFNGSSVDRNFSFSKIDFQLNRNIKKYEAYSLLPHEKPTLSIVQTDSKSMNNVSEIPTIGYSFENQENDDDFNHRKKKKKKNNNLTI
jgi:hypothetical protein